MQKGYSKPEKLNEYTTEVGAKLKTSPMPKWLIVSTVRAFVECVEAINVAEAKLVERLNQHYLDEREKWAKSLGVSATWLDAMPKGLMPYFSGQTLATDTKTAISNMDENTSRYRCSLSTTLKQLVIPEKFKNSRSDEHYNFENLKNKKNCSDEDKERFETFCETSVLAKIWTDANKHFAKKQEVLNKLADEALSCKSTKKWAELRPEIELYFPADAYKEEPKKVPSVGASRVDALLEEF